MNRDELYAEAKRLNIPGRSKMTKTELELAVRGQMGKVGLSTSAQMQDSEDTSVVIVAGDAFHSMCTVDTECECLPDPAPYNEHGEARGCDESDTVDGGPETNDPIGTGPVEQTRDMLAVLNLTYPELKRVAKTVRANIEQRAQATTTHMPNSERVQKYARQNSKHVGIWDGRGTKLTPRQMRRVRKNANKHGEGFEYAGYNYQSEERRAEMGVSLLARTPDGRGIFYRFSVDGS